MLARCTPGLTYFVQSFWQLVAVRMLASSLAQAEFVVSITIVNEEVPARRRGMLYSIVQSGWPLGVLMASAVYLTPTVAWLVVAVGASFGQWLTLLARRIPPGMRLELIAT